ncbi:hypothetical protein J8N05_07230 [Streptomyces sp. BH-SS-21]|uniref:Uncharacterized protein n=1 Tax=Streptomyces liliiviolaceus TaxID=2823109 RepID=A0A940XR73_9ACTN|nr:hypothetical protein [Streptomyces liliiviolaceus]MBQ0848003.1 hypothetical protein [Streptomyces liliiviolaceus]
MTGTDEDWLSDGLDATGADSGLWVSGVDYLTGWRRAREAADRLNRAILGAGMELSQVRAVASTNEEGRGIVRVTSWPSAVDELAGLLETLADGDGGAV